MNGKIAGIYICPVAGMPMEFVEEVEAITGQGLKGDRYATGEGSFNRGRQGRRQVTFINGQFFPDSGFKYAESRRNIVTTGVELMWLIGREFTAGEARFRGVSYCDPCRRPSNLLKKDLNFQKQFFDRGGLLAEVTEGGLIHVGDLVVPPPKGY